MEQTLWSLNSGELFSGEPKAIQYYFSYWSLDGGWSATLISLVIIVSQLQLYNIE